MLIGQGVICFNKIIYFIVPGIPGVPGVRAECYRTCLSLLKLKVNEYLSF